MTRVSRVTTMRALESLEASVAESGLGDGLDFAAQAVGIDTPLRIAEAAGAALVASAEVAGRIGVMRGHEPSRVAVASRHAEASLVSFALLGFGDPEHAPPARIAPEQRTAAAGFYRCADDRWIYLHPGFPHNTAGLLKLFDAPDDRDAVARRAQEQRAQAWEDAIGDAGLCGAMVRSPAEWDADIAGQQLATRPVVEIVQVGDSPPEPFPEDHAHPLNGTRVLDLTRVLAGPTCARTLAAFGADVLRIGSDDLPVVPLFTIDTGLGKRSAHLDLKADGRRKLQRLVKQTDVFSQGFRTGAMERLGLGVADVVAARPGAVYVSINCYGHETEWRQRPGWEQLAQTVTGMAHIQGEHTGADRPVLLAAAANDYTTGYLAALGALVALKRRAEHGGSYWVRVSLARTAVWIRELGLRRTVNARPIGSDEVAALSTTIDTEWGPLTHLRHPATLSNHEVGWDQPPVSLGSSRAAFLRRSG